MLKKIVSIVITLAFVNALGVGQIFARPSAEKEQRLAAKVKANIQKLGMGEAAKVSLKLKDKTKIEGYVSEIGEDSFTVTESPNGAKTKVDYSKVKKVKGNNLSTGAKIALGVGIALAATLVIVVLANRKLCNTGLCQ